MMTQFQKPTLWIDMSLIENKIKTVLSFFIRVNSGHWGVKLVLFTMLSISYVAPLFLQSCINRIISINIDRKACNVRIIDQTNQKISYHQDIEKVLRVEYSSTVIGPSHPYMHNITHLLQPSYTPNYDTAVPYQIRQHIRRREREIERQREILKFFVIHARYCRHTQHI